MHTGTVKRVEKQGYGFISQQDGKRDMFFHASGMADTSFDNVKAGDQVTFEIDNKGERPRAINVKIVSS